RWPLVRWPALAGPWPPDLRLQLRQSRRQTLWILHAQHRDAAIDLPNESGEHLARAELHERARAVGDEPLNDALPQHGPRHLTNRRVERGGGVALGRGIDVGDHRNPWIPGVDSTELRREPLLRRFHQRTMERRAHCERNGPASPERFRAFAGAADGHRMP